MIGTKMKSANADVNSKETRHGEADMILIGSIWCPLKVGQRKFTKTMMTESDRTATNKELVYQGKWQGCEDMLQISVEVSRCKETKDEKTMEMKSQGKAKQGDYIPSMEKYENMSYFWFVILILLQAYENMMEIPSVGKIEIIGKSYVLEGACYCFLFLLIGLMTTKPKKKKRRGKKNGHVTAHKGMWEQMNQHMKKERTVLKSFRTQEDTRFLQDTCKCMKKRNTLQRHRDMFSNVYFAGTQFPTDWETFEVREFGAGAPNGHRKLQGTPRSMKETMKVPRETHA